MFTITISNAFIWIWIRAFGLYLCVSEKFCLGSIYRNLNLNSNTESIYFFAFVRPLLSWNKKIKFNLWIQQALLNRITVNRIIRLMGSNWPGLNKHQMSIDTYFVLEICLVIVIIRLMESVIVWPKVNPLKRRPLYLHSTGNTAFVKSWITYQNKNDKKRSFIFYKFFLKCLS